MARLQLLTHGMTFLNLLETRVYRTLTAGAQSYKMHRRVNANISAKCMNCCATSRTKAMWVVIAQIATPMPLYTTIALGPVCTMILDGQRTGRREICVYSLLILLYGSWCFFIFISTLDSAIYTHSVKLRANEQKPGNENTRNVFEVSAVIIIVHSNPCMQTKMIKSIAFIVTPITN